MDAVFRPGLSQCLHFHVSGVTPQPVKVGGNGVELVFTKRELLPSLAYLQLFQGKFVLWAFRKPQRLRSDGVLDDGVYQ